jgi:hypothetical protein
MSVQRSDAELLAEYDRKLDALTLEEVWAVIMRAWLARRRDPRIWRSVAFGIDVWLARLADRGAMRPRRRRPPRPDRPHITIGDTGGE